jgi:hypothetical protein
MELKKDPIGIYFDIKIDPNRDLDSCTKDELLKLLEMFENSDVEVDRNPNFEKIFETYGPDREVRKKAIEDRLKLL